MPQNPPEGTPRVIPYLLYEDVGATVDWLMAAFGFTDGGRMAGPDGAVLHASVQLADGVVMMGCPGPDYENPAAVGAGTQLTYVYVDDVDAHYERAKAAGAQILMELGDRFYGDRTSAAADPEGHQWSFAQHVRDVDPEDLHP